MCVVMRGIKVGATDSKVEAQVERDVEGAGVFCGIRCLEIIHGVVMLAVHIVFEFAFLPFDGVGVPFAGVFDVGDALLVAVCTFA